MIDGYNRRINYLRVSITDRCNLRCRYCMDEDGIKLLPKEKILTIEDFAFVINALIKAGIEKVRITGGEPLIKKGVFTLFEMIDKSSLKDFSITTNGVLLENYAEKLKITGVKRVNISLDSLNRDKFRYITRRDYFDRVIKGIKKAVEVGLNPVKINVVAIRGFNDDEICDFAEFAIQNSVHIRFIEFMPFGEFGKEKFISNSEIKEILERRYSLERVESKNSIDGPAKNFRIKGTEGFVGFISPLSEHFCHRCNRIRLLADGNLKTCLFSDKLYSIFKEIKLRNEDTLVDRIRSILKEKPRQHSINIKRVKFRKCQQEMRSIGG